MSDLIIFNKNNTSDIMPSVETNEILTFNDNNTKIDKLYPNVKETNDTSILPFTTRSHLTQMDAVDTVKVESVDEVTNFNTTKSVRTSVMTPYKGADIPVTYKKPTLLTNSKKMSTLSSTSSPISSTISTTKSTSASTSKPITKQMIISST